MFTCAYSVSRERAAIISTEASSSAAFRDDELGKSRSITASGNGGWRSSHTCCIAPNIR